MWEQIIATVIIELIRRRLDEKDRGILDVIKKDVRDPERALLLIISQGTLHKEAVGFFADTVETILERLRL